MKAQGISQRVIFGLLLVAIVGYVVWYFLAGSVLQTAPDEQPVIEVYTASVKERTIAPESDAQLVVTVVNDIVLEENGLTREAAQVACEAVAYNTDYMWQQVICTFEGEEIYNDIFIAG